MAKPESTQRVVRFVDAVAWSPAGDVLVLHWTEDGRLGLDRYRRVESLTERIHLTSVPGKMPIRMVAGQEGLFFASSSPGGRLFVLTWEELDQVESWEQVLVDVE